MADSSSSGAEIPKPGAARVLVISGMYPSDANPTFGAFIAKQDAAMTMLGVEHRMVANSDPRTGAIAGLRKYGSLLLRTLAAARRRDFDVVAGHFLYPSAWLARLAARIGRTPYVVVAHGTDVSSVQRGGWLAEACLRATREAACVVAVSRDLERRVRSELALPATVETAVIDMGVDRAVFHPRDDARGQMGWAAGERVALFAGNLIPRKAPDVLVDAFALLRARDACDRLALVGDGEMRLRLEGRAAERGCADAVAFPGSMPPARLALAMAAADVFVLPSRAEPLGVVLLEAMACGTPCVASDVGGIPEVLGPACGRLVPPDDPEALAAAIQEVLRDGKEPYREACLATAEAHDLTANTEVFCGVLDRAAAKGRSAQR